MFLSSISNTRESPVKLIESIKDRTCIRTMQQRIEEWWKIVQVGKAMQRTEEFIAIMKV